MLDDKILALVRNEGYQLSKDDDDFEIIKGNVENWINFGDANVTIEQAVKNTMEYKDPFENY
jgi:hypothetical protein